MATPKPSHYVPREEFDDHKQEIHAHLSTLIEMHYGFEDRLNAQTLQISALETQVIGLRADQRRQEIALGARMDTLEARLTARMDALEVKIDAVEVTLNARMDALETKMTAQYNELRYLLTSIITALHVRVLPNPELHPQEGQA